MSPERATNIQGEGVPGISHQTEEQLELYALGRLDESSQAAVEEHLLICTACRERLDEAESFALSMRQAIAKEPAPEPKPGWRGFRWPVWAAGFAVLVLAVVFVLNRGGKNIAPLASLQLTAVRGEAPVIGVAQETDITLTDAPTEPGLRVEVVDSNGAPTATSLRITKPLATGSYFVRLYDSAGKLLHEYAFRVLIRPHLTDKSLVDGTFLDNAQRIFDTACADDSNEPKDFALLVHTDGGLHFVMESPLSVHAVAGTAYRVTKTSDGSVRVTGRNGNHECVLEKASTRKALGHLLRDQPLYWISSPLTISAPS